MSNRWRRGRLGFLAAGLTVTDLHDLGQLQARFNADRGRPRLVLAVAPA